MEASKVKGAEQTDDRGRPVRVLDPAGVADWPMAGDLRITLLAQRMQAASMMSRWWQITLGIILVTGAAMTMLAVRAFFPTVPRWLHIVPVMLAVLTISSLGARVRKRRASSVLTRLLLEEGLCPCCGYNFHGLAPAADGVLACPECGAAWRAERVRRAEAFASGARMADANTVMVISSASWVGKDDRGSRCPYVHPRLRKQIKAASEEEVGVRMRKAEREIARNGRILRWTVAALLVGGSAAGGVAVVLWGHAAAGLARLSVLLPLLFFGGLGLGVLFGNFGYSRLRVKRVMLSNWLCPSCAASVEGLKPEEDGRVVCAQCLSAWELPVG